MAENQKTKVFPQSFLGQPKKKPLEAKKKDPQKGKIKQTFVFSLASAT